MPKTAPPAEVKVPGISTPFRASAVPDAFDERDLVYQPRLQPLPAELDVRPTDKSQHYVMTQQGSSCTGHAVASMINVVLARNVQLGFAEQVATTSGRRRTSVSARTCSTRWPGGTTSSPATRTRARRCEAP